MGKIAGVKIEKDSKGRIKKVTFDARKYAYIIEDVLDAIAMEARKDEPKIAMDDVFAEQDKKRDAAKRTAKK